MEQINTESGSIHDSPCSLSGDNNIEGNVVSQYDDEDDYPTQTNTEGLRRRHRHHYQMDPRLAVTYSTQEKLLGAESIKPLKSTGSDDLVENFDMPNMSGPTMTHLLWIIIGLIVLYLIYEKTKSNGNNISFGF